MLLLLLLHLLLLLLLGQYKRIIKLYYKRLILSNQKSSLKQKYKLSSGVPNSDFTNSKDQ